MTYEYKVINGKVIVGGDEGLQERENVQNLGHILELENKIEVLRKLLNETEKEHKKYNYKPIRTKKNRFIRSVLNVSGVALAVFIIVQLVLFLNSGFNINIFKEVTETIFGPMKFWQFFTIAMEIIWVPISMLSEGLMWKRENARIEEVLGLEALMDCLEKDLEVNETELQKAQEMSLSRPSAIESDIVSMKSFNTAYKESIDKLADRIKSLGAIRDELVKYSDDASLVERLKQEGLQSGEIEMAKDFIMKEKNRVYPNR